MRGCMCGDKLGFRTGLRWPVRVAGWVYPCVRQVAVYQCYYGGGTGAVLGMREAVGD